MGSFFLSLWNLDCVISNQRCDKTVFPNKFIILILLNKPTIVRFYKL